MRTEIDRLADVLEQLVRQARGERLLTWKQVAKRLGMTTQMAWRVRKADPRFPKPVKPKGARERWVEREVDAFVGLLIEERERSVA